jgi:hypothetical protein
VNLTAKHRRAAWRLALAVAVLLVLAPRAAPAQEAEARRLYGIEGGLNLSRLRFSEEFLQAETAMRLHFSAGGAAVFPLGQDFDLRTGLRWIRHGSRLDFESGPSSPAPRTGEFTVTQDYIGVPAMLRWHDSMTGMTFYGTGLEADYLIGASAKVQEFFPSGPPSSVEGSILGDLERFNLSLLFTAGAEFPVGVNFWHMELRYSLGLTDVAKDGAYDFNWKTAGLEILFGGLW